MFDLKGFRKYLGLTQKEFSERIGVNPSGIANVEVGTRSISTTLLNAIKLVFQHEYENFIALQNNTIQEPVQPYSSGIAELLMMIKDKDIALEKCRDEKEALLREIIELKDQQQKTQKAVKINTGK